jgi:dCTP deaminase
MILSGKKIKEKLGDEIIIKPYSDKQLNPNSYNVRLHNEVLTYDNPVLDMRSQNTTKKITIPAEGMILTPGILYLGRTVEFTKTTNFVPMLEGRSSIGRLGLFIHITAGFGDVGFSGYWTLEMFCVHPIKIYPFVEIGQIFYYNIDGDFTPYKSNKYQDNKGIQPSMMYKEF